MKTDKPIKAKEAAKAAALKAFPKQTKPTQIAISLKPIKDQIDRVKAEYVRLMEMLEKFPNVN